MPDTREITVEVVNEASAREAISRDPRGFGCWMRDALTGRDAAFDSARVHLREEFGVAITATRKVFTAER